MKGKRTHVLASILAVAISFLTVPARALPPGPPAISFDAHQAGPLTFELIAILDDPDGDLTAAELCVEGACSSETFDASAVPGSLDSCALGDQESLSVLHDFPSAGSFEVTVRATGGGCLLLGSSETTEAVFELEVPEPPEPPPTHEPIVCAEPGTPTASAPGVDVETVTLAATVPMSGPEASVRGEVAAGIRAATEVINSFGGVCDRLLELRLINDGGDAQRRRQYVQALIAEDDVFAFVAQDVQGNIDLLEEAGVPAVGTPAAARDEFDASWVWPIRAGNDAFGWISVEEAYEVGARRFAIVYEQDDPLGEETREAVQAAVASHGDAELVTQTPLPAGIPSYGEPISSFNVACGQGCDAVIYALGPQAMLTWMAGAPRRGTIRDSAHPVMFSTDMATSCQSSCDGIVTWTDFQPPIGSPPGEVERYCQDLHAYSPQADCYNTHTEAAYAAVFVAARAMGLVGVDLTRDGFAEALDSSSFDLGLTGGSLAWSVPRRQANRWMRGYSIVIVSMGTFAGWRDETGWYEDPRP